MRPEIAQRGVDGVPLVVALDSLGQLRERFCPGLGGDGKKGAEKLENPCSPLSRGERLMGQEIFNRKEDGGTSAFSD